MIEYHYELQFELSSEARHTNWLTKVVASEGRQIKQIDYIFCNDDYLAEMNYKYLKHSTLTDILTFDYSNGNEVVADIYISVERVRENAHELEVDFEEELLRVMVHGVLHIMGYQDKSRQEQLLMRKAEEQKIKMFHVEQ